jgi:hypothetical protein
LDDFLTDKAEIEHRVELAQEMIRRNSLEKINRINPVLGLLRVMTHHNTCLTSKPHAIIALIDALALIWATGRRHLTVFVHKWRVTFSNPCPSAAQVQSR